MGKKMSQVSFCDNFVVFQTFDHIRVSHGLTKRVQVTTKPSLSFDSRDRNIVLSQDRRRKPESRKNRRTGT